MDKNITKTEEALQTQQSVYAFPDVNKVMVAGRLVHNPPLRKTKKGVPVTNFIIETFPEKIQESTEGMARESCQISVVVWAQQALHCHHNLKKGNTLLIVGELQSMPNANPNKHFFPVQINAQWIQYLDTLFDSQQKYDEEEKSETEQPGVDDKERNQDSDINADWQEQASAEHSETEPKSADGHSDPEGSDEEKGGASASGPGSSTIPGSDL